MRRLCRSDGAKNAVLLGCLLIGLTTVINSVGVRLMARINNVGVIAELVGVTVLIVLLAVHVRRGPSVLFDVQGRGEGRPGGYLGPFLAAALMASYVLYGFDTAGTLAEETDLAAPPSALGDPPGACRRRARRRAPDVLRHPRRQRPGPARAGPDQRRPAVSCQGRARAQAGCFPACSTVIFAVFVCALAVHAGSVRLMFAMARDNNLPFAHSLAHVQAWSKAPMVPSVVVGVLAAAILIVNINLPNVIETLCSVAIVWANLAYLLVTMPLLLRGCVAAASRLRPWRSRRRAKPATISPSSFRWADGGCPSTRLRSCGAVRRDQHQLAARGDLRVRRLGSVRGAPGYARLDRGLARSTFLLFQRRRTGILSEHAAEDILECESFADDRSADRSPLDRSARTR